MKVVGVIQARMGSSRLPGKVLKEVAGKPLLVHMLDRVLRSCRLDSVCLAIPIGSADDPIVDAINNRVTIYRGSEEDVLSRYLIAASGEDADVVVRLTADCPLHDPEIIDDVVSAYNDRSHEVDYLSNTLTRTFPDGLDVEVFSFEALSRAEQEAVSPYHREHVTPYIYCSKDKVGSLFRIAEHKGMVDFSHLRWTVDEKEDYLLVKAIYEKLYPHNPAFGWMDIVSLVTRDLRLLQLNSHLA